MQLFWLMGERVIKCTKIKKEKKTLTCKMYIHSQTGSGKTFSMGTSLDNSVSAENEGLCSPAIFGPPIYIKHQPNRNCAALYH